jgi:hypothetical protein
MTANGFPDQVICGACTETARASQKARIHSGTVEGKQPGPSVPGYAATASQMSEK